MEPENRVVVLIDMDCFYCQVEEKLDPELKGKPIAVVQYNPWKGGGIIAVNYEARARGVTRHMRGDEAKEKCPEIQLPSVPCQRGKADITKYREAGKEVARVLQRFTTLLERASIDEAYLDITAPVQERLKTLNTNTINTDMMPNTYALGYNTIEEFISDVQCCSSDSIDFDYEHAKRLLVGAVIVSEIRAAVYEDTGYRCSAGISHNKILAKLVCGMNKPNKQTVLPKHTINILYKTLPVKKVKHLGGKFGDTVCEVLNISKMGELQMFTEKHLQARFDEKNGTWLYNIARGIDLEPVQARFNPKSIGCCKQLRGKSALYDLDSLKKWLTDLGDEIEDRLEKDAVESNRTPKQMVVSFTTTGPDGRDSSSSRSYNFVADDELGGALFANKALELVLDSLEGVKYTGAESNRKLRAPIKFLGISVGKFEDNSESKKTKKILDYFVAGSANATKTKDDTKPNVNKETTAKKNEGKEYILQKFFNTQNAVKAKTRDVKTDDDANIQNKEDKESYNVIQSPLEKQESFFARFLNKGTTTKTESTIVAKETSTSVRPTTPVCNVVTHEDKSNDSDYSSSTINMEINKSIALFEEDPQDIERVSHMRELLNVSSIQNKSGKSSRSSKGSDDLLPEKENGNDDEITLHDDVKDKTPSPQKVDTFKCQECGKALPMQMYETHADYHFALKIREEDRKRARDERTRSKPLVPIPNEDIKPIAVKTKKKDSNEGTKSKKEDPNKNKTMTPIASFFVKLDETIPTESCPECGKKVPIEKLAEHSDFHEAQKLSRELNGNRKVLSSVYFETSVKRKRKSVSPTKKPKMHCPSKSIDSFFR
ncbi:impB/mucB/samB family domain-containing protein [Phthorimaea operculella]|nr:impB/mucB/samB family domain-containing protein [Phthorimaea operculella]